MKGGYVYIMSNKNRTVLYIGVTANLERRVSEHKLSAGSAFTRAYNCTDLLYYERYDDIKNAIAREKQLKNWKREWKDELIKSINPGSKDLSLDW